MPTATSTNLRLYQATLTRKFDNARTMATRELEFLLAQETSDGRENRYYWTNQRTRARRWTGDRQPVAYSTVEYVLENEPWELSFEVDKHDFEDDKLGLYDARARDFGLATEEHPDDQAVELLQNFSDYQCYDGRPFFDQAHPVDPAGGAYGTFANLVGSSALTPANYTARKAEFRQFLGSDGRPFGGRPTHLVVPPQLEDAGKEILTAEIIAEGSNGAAVTNRNRNDATLVVSDKLAEEPDVWYLVWTDPIRKPLVRQLRSPPVFTSMVDLNSENVFRRRKFEFGVDWRDAYGYGIPQCMMRCEADAL